VLATERGVDLERQARLAAGGCVRMDGTDLGGAVEGAERLGQSGIGIDRRVGGLGGASDAFATNVFAALRRGCRTSWRLWA
jgi:hypothetical protein